MKNLNNNIDEQVDAILQSWDEAPQLQTKPNFAKGVHAKLAWQRKAQRRRVQMAIAASILWAVVNVAVVQTSISKTKNLYAANESSGYEQLYNEYFPTQTVYSF